MDRIKPDAYLEASLDEAIGFVGALGPGVAFMTNQATGELILIIKDDTGGSVVLEEDKIRTLHALLNQKLLN